MKVHESEELLTITRSERIRFMANFTKVLYSDTLASVVSVTQILNTGLVATSPAINTTDVDVEGKTVVAYKGVQFWLDARASATPPDGATTGSAKIRVVVTTADGDTIGLDCRILVKE